MLPIFIELTLFGDKEEKILVNTSEIQMVTGRTDKETGKPFSEVYVKGSIFKVHEDLKTIHTMARHAAKSFIIDTIHDSYSRGYYR